MRYLPNIIVISILAFLPFSVDAARLLSIGFEWQSVTDGVEVVTNYGEAISTTQVHGGTQSAVLTGSIGADAAIGFDSTFASAATAYARWYVYIDSLANTGTVSLFLDFYSGATNVIALDITNTAGVYTVTPYYNNFGANLTPFIATLEDGWHYIEILYDTSPANGSEVFTVRLDGVEQASATNLTFTTKTVTLISQGLYNGGVSSNADSTVYLDDLAVNNSSAGGTSTSYPGEGKIAILVPNAAGFVACTNSAAFGAVNEIPPSNTATNNTNMCELDTTTSVGMFGVTDSSTAGIDSFDTVTLVQLMMRVREETAGTSNWFPQLSSNGNATSTGSSVDAGNATARTNPNSTTAFGNILISYTDPQTTVAWTPTGTNSIDNMQIGAGTTDGTPDTWVLTMAAFVEYVDGAAPAGAATYSPIFYTNGY